jgi:hypothetical protein
MTSFPIEHPWAQFEDDESHLNQTWLNQMKDRQLPQSVPNIQFELILKSARAAVFHAWHKAPEGYRDVNGRDELKDVLPQSWYPYEKRWLEDCLGRQPTKEEWFTFWMYWRMCMMQAKHEGGIDPKPFA